MAQLTSPKRSTLLQADQTAQRAWHDALRGCVSSERQATLLICALKSPYLRHMLEFYLNDSITVIGARMLLQMDMIRVTNIVGRPRYARGLDFHGLEFTPEGENTVDRFLTRFGDQEWLQTLTAGILDYACRDEGDGICLGREHLSTAIDNMDVEVLNRLIYPSGGMQQLPDLTQAPRITEADRLADEALWSPRYEGHTSARISGPLFHYGRPEWLLEDEHMAEAEYSQAVSGR